MYVHLDKTCSAGSDDKCYYGCMLYMDACVQGGQEQEWAWGIIILVQAPQNILTQP